MRDFFRLWWGLLYWNLRKTLFVLRRRKGQSPCQTPSDSGRAWVTHCDACLLWDRRERFRRVCPDYRPGPDGWRCAANTEEVRPYWGRAAGFGAALLAGVYLVGAVGVWGFLAATGVEGLGPVDAIWPGRWTRINSARSAYFVREARAALQQGDPQRTALNLSTAVILDPSDYETRLAMVQVYALISAAGFADGQFRQLWTDFPRERARTAVIWHDLLVGSRRFGALARVASSRLSAPDEREKPAWLRAWFVALRGAADPAALVAQNQALLDAVEPEVRAVIAAEAGVRRSGAARSGWPRTLVGGNYTLLVTLWGETFADTAGALEGTDEILRLGPLLGPFQVQRLLYRLHVRNDVERAALGAFDGMLRVAGEPAERAQVVASVIERPFGPALERLADAARNPAFRFSPQEAAGLWVAGTMGGHDELRAAAGRLLRAAGIDVAHLPTEATPGNAMLWMRVLPLSRECAYALALRYPERAGGGRS